jgi:hypothetical protein
VRLEGLGQLEYPMTLPTIEPATFRLVAQCLNQLGYRVPPIIIIIIRIIRIVITIMPFILSLNRCQQQIPHSRQAVSNVQRTKNEKRQLL